MSTLDRFRQLTSPDGLVQVKAQGLDLSTKQKKLTMMPGGPSARDMEKFNFFNPNATDIDRLNFASQMQERSLQTQSLDYTASEIFRDSAIGVLDTAQGIALKGAGAVASMFDGPSTTLSEDVRSVSNTARQLGQTLADASGFSNEYRGIFGSNSAESQASIRDPNQEIGSKGVVSTSLYEAADSVSEYLKQFKSEDGRALDAATQRANQEYEAARMAELPENPTSEEIQAATLDVVDHWSRTLQGESVAVKSVESLPYLFAAGKASSIGSNLNKSRVQNKAKRKGTTATKEQLDKAGETGAVIGSTAAVAGLEGSSTAADVYNTVNKADFTALEENSEDYRSLITSGATPEEARNIVARLESGKAGKSMALFAALSNLATGGVAEKLVGQSNAGGSLVQAGKAAVTEAPEEAVQSAAGTVTANQAEQNTVDNNKDLGTGVATAAVEGATIGAVSAGGTVAATSGLRDGVGNTVKAAKATADGVSKLASAASKAVDNITETVAPDTSPQESYKAAQQSPEETVAELMKLDDTTFTANITAVATARTALLEKAKDPNTPEAEREAIIKQGRALRDRIIKTTEKADQEFKKSAEAVKAAPDTATEEQTQQAYIENLTNPEPELGIKLSGSKHITEPQQSLLADITENPERYSSVRGKDHVSVHADVVEGTEGYTGVVEYLDIVSTALRAKDSEGALFALRKLRNLARIQNKKVTEGKFPNGNQIPANVMTFIADEAKSADLAYSALRDLTAKAFPEVASVLNQNKGDQPTGTSRVREQLNQTEAGETITLPRTQRQALVQQAVTSLPKIKRDDPNFNAVRNAFPSGDAESFDSVVSATKTVDKISAIAFDKRTKQDRADLKQAQDVLDDAYLGLRDALGDTGLVNTLATYGDAEEVQKITSYKPTSTPLDTEVETVLGHTPVPDRTSELSTAEDFESYDNLRNQIREFVEENPSVLDDDRVEATYNSVTKAEIGVFSRRTEDTFNRAAGLMNHLKIPNSEVRAANSEVRARSTTPHNRVFQNVVEASQPNSILRSFRSVPRRLGLIHTEANLVQKLSDVGSDIYNHLTKGLSTEDLQDTTDYVKFLATFEKKLNATLVGRKTGKGTSKSGKTIEYTTNDHLDSFIKDGKFDPSIATAIASGFANWVSTNGSKTLYTKDSAIADLLGQREGYIPNHAERTLRDAGMSMSHVAQQIGKDTYKTLGLSPKATANENHQKQLIANLGMAAIAASLVPGGGTPGILVRQYAHIEQTYTGPNGARETVAVTLSDSHTKPKSTVQGSEIQTISMLKAVPNKSQPEDGITRLNTNIERATAGALNDTVARDIFGMEPSFVKPVLDNEEMVQHSVDDGIAPQQVEALNRSQEIKYVPDREIWGIMNELDEDYRMALVDGIPPKGAEHANNTTRNESLRQDIRKDFENVQAMLKHMDDAGSSSVRFPSQASRRNLRMMQRGTWGTPQDNKLVRHIFKMDNIALTIDPSDNALLSSYKLATMEALDEDSTEGRGVDKSTDESVIAAFDALLESGKYDAAIAAVNSPNRTREDIEAIQSVIGLPSVKRATGTTGTAIKLDGLLALAKYNPDAPFEVNLFKENDGIANGIALGLLQFAGADSFEDYKERLAQVGVFVDDARLRSFGDFANTGKADVYVSFGAEVVNTLNNPDQYPATDKNILPTVNNSSQSIIDFPIKFHIDGSVPVTDSLGNVQEKPRYWFNKKDKVSYVRNTRREYDLMSGALNYFMGKGFRNKEGQFKEVLGYVDELIRDFAKSPLMLSGYGAAIKGLKLAMVNNVMDSITLALEDLNQLQGESRAAAIANLELAVNNLSPQRPESGTFVFRVADNPLETEVDRSVRSLISYGVESTLGPALESTFQRMYGKQRERVDKVIQSTRLSTDLYARLLTHRKEEVRKELGRDYLTVAENTQIIDELRPYAPIVASAMSEDYLNDGIWIAKGENTKDTEEGTYVNEATDKVKLSLKFGSNSSAETHTYSDSVKDPGVSAGAVLTQSLDASTQVQNMAKANITNVHDALIVNLADSGNVTLDHNEGFFNVISKYNMTQAALDTLKRVASHPLVQNQDTGIQRGTQAELSSALERHLVTDLEGFIEATEHEIKTIEAQRNLVLESSVVNVNQYSAGHESGITMVPENVLSTEEKSKAWETATGRVQHDENGNVIAGSTGDYQTPSQLDLLQETEIDKANVRTIFEGIADLGAVTPSREHREQLSRMIDIIEPIVKKVNLKVFGLAGETAGAVTDSGINLTINTSAKVNGIEMSAQEVLVHELTHTLFHNADKSSRAYKEIVKMYSEARKELRPSDFLQGVSNPTPDDLRAAKERYDHTVHNRVEGGQEYTTYLKETKQFYNADPVEEFAVMALTNEHLRNALRTKDLRLKNNPEGFFGKLAALVERLLNAIGIGLDNGSIKADERIVRMVEHLQGSMNQKRSLLYRAVSIADGPIDAASEFMQKAVQTHTDKYKAIHEGLADLDTYKDMKAWADSRRRAALDTAVAKNTFVTSMFNEFTTGRKALAELARLVAKSSQVIERTSQFLKETVTKEMLDIFEGVTKDESETLYRLLQTDIQSLLDRYELSDIKTFMYDSTIRKAQINKILGEIRTKAGGSARYIQSHAQDLGYHMVTGERLIADGQYINAHQLARMWGYDGNYAPFDATEVEPLIDELSTLHALEYAGLDTKLNQLFTERFSGNQFEAYLNMQSQIVRAGLETTFKDNEYNMRKGYIKEEFENQVDIIVGTAEEHDDLIDKGYRRGDRVVGDPLAPRGEQYFYIRENAEMAKYLTGALSTAQPATRGTDPFRVSPSDSEVHTWAVEQDKEKLSEAKQKVRENTFAGAARYLNGEARKHIVQPVFDSSGRITKWRYVPSHYMKDTVHGRNLDFANAMGGTLSSVSRRMQTKNINQELMEYFHNTYKKEYSKTPELFVNIAEDPKYRDQYSLIPIEARMQAEELFGSKDIWIPRTQIDIALGYRKFSVAQLQVDKSPQASAYREVLRLANNTLAVSFNNQVGISIEAFWQSFVATAKDTLVIKSGIVTAANIGSNLALLWMSGVSPAQSIKDHAIAYPATEKYIRDQEREFKVGLELRRPNLLKQERKALESEQAMLRQELFNNPVRELMEAGMYSAIVDDVDVGENASEAKDWFDKKIEPYLSKAPSALVEAGKLFMLTHDTKAYKVMRNMAQISDFAARYSLHKHNLAQGMSQEDSISDVRTTFVDYDIPSHKSIQYANDMGLLGFTKYFFRIQQVIVKRFAEKPARMLSFALFNNMLGLGIATPTDAMFGTEALVNRVYGPDDWLDFSTMSAPMNLLVN